MEPYAMETLTVTSADATVGLTTTTYRPASGGLPVKWANVSVDAGPIISYVQTSTVTASSTVGHKMTAFMQFELKSFDAIRNFRTTSVSSGTLAQITVTYFR